jgi:hydroxyacylglutathione hydrolase
VLIQQYVIEGLGHLSTMLADEEAGTAIVVDPRRDVDVYVAAAAERDLRVTHVLETHLHNDYVSGARELASLTGAQHVIGVGAELRYEHRAVRDGESFRSGSLEVSVLDAPGHTPEHVVYAVADAARAGEPALLLTGGSLLVGAVGRTDLLGAEHAVPYAHAMRETLRGAIFGQADYVTILPTHGAGSLCSTGIASTPSSTIGYERRHHPVARTALEDADPEAFVRALLLGQPAVPRYFARMRPTNQAGPEPLGLAPLPPRPLEPAAVAELARGGALVVDLRDPAQHVLAHVPGSLSIPAGSSFGTWLGWVVEPDRPLVLLLDDAADREDAVRQAARVGFERSIVGHVRGGLDAWRAAGLPIESNGRLTVDELAAALAGDGGGVAPLVIDVRQRSEYERAHVPGALHLGAGDLQDRLAELPRDRPIATICASGYRASVAASILRSAGFENVSWVAEGVPAWRRSGHPVERRLPRPTDENG